MNAMKGKTVPIRIFEQMRDRLKIEAAQNRETIGARAMFLLSIGWGAIGAKKTRKK